MENLKKYTQMTDDEESCSDLFESDIEKNKPNRNNKRPKTQSTSSKKIKQEKPQTSYMTKINQLIQDEDIIDESINTLTVKQDGHNVILKYPKNDSEDYWVLQHYKISDIEKISSSDRWKHASCSIKMYTERQNNKDKTITNVLQKVIEMISERFANDPNRKITKYKLDTK